jgi:hypothetical protein
LSILPLLMQPSLGANACRCHKRKSQLLLAFPATGEEFSDPVPAQGFDCLIDWSGREDSNIRSLARHKGVAISNSVL